MLAEFSVCCSVVWIVASLALRSVTPDAMFKHRLSSLFDSLISTETSLCSSIIISSAFLVASGSAGSVGKPGAGDPNRLSILLFHISLMWTSSLLILDRTVRLSCNSCVLAISCSRDPVCTDRDVDLRAGEPESLEERLSEESDRWHMFMAVGEAELYWSVTPNGEVGCDMVLIGGVGRGDMHDDGIWICSSGVPSLCTTCSVTEMLDELEE